MKNPKYVVISDFGPEQSLISLARTLAEAKRLARAARVCTAVVYRVTDGRVCYTK